MRLYLNILFNDTTLKKSKNIYGILSIPQCMMNKTIKISESTHHKLSEFASKKDTFDDVINFLINYYINNEEFTNKEAEYYNKEIEYFENGNLENIHEITLKDLEKRILKLENELKP